MLRVETYKVTISHPNSERHSGLHIFKVHPDGDRGFYAVAPIFGCSKTYRTPEIAIRQMVADHAALVCKIEKQQPNKEEDYEYA